jgi:hypothetical protein
MGNDLGRTSRLLKNAVVDPARGCSSSTISPTYS